MKSISNMLLLSYVSVRSMACWSLWIRIKMWYGLSLFLKLKVSGRGSQEAQALRYGR